MQMTGAGLTGGNAARLLALAAALLIAACGSDTPPPLTGNLIDERGDHAGSFLPANTQSDEPAANAATANSQDDPR